MWTRSSMVSLSFCLLLNTQTTRSWSKGIQPNGSDEALPMSLFSFCIDHKTPGFSPPFFTLGSIHPKILIQRLTRHFCSSGGWSQTPVPYFIFSFCKNSKSSFFWSCLKRSFRFFPLSDRRQAHLRELQCTFWRILPHRAGPKIPWKVADIPSWRVRELFQCQLRWFWLKVR